MSEGAMMWALDAVTSDSVARLILVVLGRDSDDQGKGAALTIPEIATQALCSPRTAQRKIQDLAKEGLIVPGDESIVADRQANYRPAVWDLAMPSKPTPTTTRRGDTATPLGVTRRHPKDGQGRHSDTPRGDTATPLEAGDLASTERVTTSTPFGSAAPTQAPTREHAREAAPRTTRGTRLPADWKPDAELAQWTLDAGMSREQARRTLEDFRDYWTEKTGKDATKVTWSGTWKRWVRRELDNKPSRNSGRRPGKTLTLNDVLDDLDATEGGYRPDPMVIDMEAC